MFQDFRVAADRRRSRDDHIFVRDRERCWLLRVREIRLLEVIGNSTRLHVGTDRPIAPRSLRHFEEHLDPLLFFRANRTQIVNIDWIQSLALDPGDRFIAKLRDGTEVEISRRQARVLRARLEL